MAIKTGVTCVIGIEAVKIFTRHMFPNIKVDFVEIEGDHMMLGINGEGWDVAMVIGFLHGRNMITHHHIASF